MDERSVLIAGVAALIAALLVVAYFIRRLRLRETKRRMGNVSRGISTATPSIGSPGLRERSRADASWGAPTECQALVQAAFDRAAEAKLFGKAHSLEIEKHLLATLAEVKSEFGLPDRFGVRAGGRPRIRRAGELN
jgi:hypothetical protein